MPGGRVSLAMLMKLTALIASELALIGSDVRILTAPVFLFGIVALNLVAIQGVILGRPLRAFHYTFQIVGFMFSVAISLLIFATGFPVVLVILIRNVFGVARVDRFFTHVSAVDASGLVGGILGIVLAWAAGLLAARRGRRSSGRFWKITASFFQGALIGLGLWMITSTILFQSELLSLPAPRPSWWYAYLAGLAVSPMIGALAVCLTNRPEKTEGPGQESGAIATPAGHV